VRTQLGEGNSSRCRVERVPDPEARRGSEFRERHSETEDEMRKYNQRPNIEMEPTLLTVRALMSPRRAAHFAR
jgi:hypothetical protein